ncbi:pilus assembly protein PilO [Desulfobacter hydrogenophilus]|uniref:Pilus assembly protein PilO n=1 Tax=Desulfobacter hydrogenophilus TaxID=2291 RepID=A0A328FHB2_9BACT|nr:type 4a pilus biogenesis protein PilO [Desulfobacter hydrogenophilus]NDY71692.1 type 4a pilus biogenesis protein PilO [Desulfobacter hydrogenophilus]QBH13204.1 pilus assembly protein PilO [Desulfobacter hydrogenophilus]RAM02375.1 pilus assembly protein PilO [Desulfobacter hydrogenophilus]
MAGKKKDSNVKKSGQMDALFEKIGALTKVQRLLICFGTLGLIGAGFYFLLLGPKLDSLTAARQNLENQKNLLSTYKIKAAALEKVEAQMAQAQEQFNIAMTALPDKRELPSLLDEISKAGRDAGLEVQLFAPQNMVNNKFYTEIPFSMTIAGRYHQIAEFFYRVAGLNRVVNISAINMDRMSGKDAADRNKIQMKCVAVTYMFVEPKEDENTGKKGKKRRKRG